MVNGHYEVLSVVVYVDGEQLCSSIGFGIEAAGKRVYSFSQLLWLNSWMNPSETISSDLWTISFLFTSDWNFLLIWANWKCFGTCVQTVSTIVCSLHTTNFIWLVDQNWWFDSHFNCQTLTNFSIIFHRVSHHIHNDPFNYQKLVYTHDIVCNVC